MNHGPRQQYLGQMVHEIMVHKSFTLTMAKCGFEVLPHPILTVMPLTLAQLASLVCVSELVAVSISAVAMMRPRATRAIYLAASGHVFSANRDRPDTSQCMYVAR